MRSINFFSVLLIISAIVFLPANLSSRVTIGSAATPQDFSVLELVSNSTMGLRLPQLTTEERDALTPDLRGNADAKGLLIFNTTYQCVETWSGDEWISLCVGERPDPCAGLAEMNTTFCIGDRIADLTARTREAGGRGTIEWFLEATGGDPLPAMHPLEDGETYYAGNCAGATARTSVTVSLINCSLILPGNIRVTAFVSVLYDFQTQRLETWTTTAGTGGEATSVQWQVRAGSTGDWTDIAGATSAIFTLPANFIHRPEFADNVNYLYFRTVVSNPVSTNVAQSDNFLQIRFIRTTERDGITFLPGYGITNGVRWATMRRARHNNDAANPNTIRVALLNVGATDNDGVGLGSLFQWGRIADGHQRIVWGKDPGRGVVRNNVFADGTSGTVARTDNMSADVNLQGQATGIFAGNFITGTGDWGAGAPDRVNLWGGIGTLPITRANLPVSLDDWTERARINNPCPSGWRVPSSAEWGDMHQDDGINTGSNASSDGGSSGYHNLWTLRPASSGAVGGRILTNDIGTTLFLPIGGWRNTSGNLEQIHILGHYWSSTGTGGNNSFGLWVGTNNIAAGSFSSQQRANGSSVRCVSDN